MQGIDVVEVLEDFNIDYIDEGVNVTKGWVEVQCIYCDDPSKHLGIRLTDGFTKCWRCGHKGNLINFLSESSDNTYSEVKGILEDYKIRFTEPEKHDSTVFLNSVEPKGLCRTWPDIYLDYLELRGFDPYHVIDKYKLKPFPLYGDWAGRIYIPIFYNRNLMSYTSRSVNPNSHLRYKNCPNDKCFREVKNLVYNIDTVQDKMLIVEGPIDVWKIGGGCVAVFGIEFTEHQISLLTKTPAKKAYVMFDAEPIAAKRAKQLAESLSLFIDTEIVHLDYGDPGELSKSDIIEVRKAFLC